MDNQAPVAFENEQIPQPAYVSQKKGLIGAIVKTGVVKNEKEAQYLLLGLAGILLLVAIILPFTGPRQSDEPPVRESEDYLLP